MHDSLASRRMFLGGAAALATAALLPRTLRGADAPAETPATKPNSVINVQAAVRRGRRAAG